MALAKTESTEPCERQVQIVCSLEVSSGDEPHMPLHIIAGAQDSLPGQVTAYLL